MKRKVIQIADSTQLISLPRKWCIENNIKKGDELSVDVEGTKVLISSRPDLKLESAELKLEEYGVLARRVIHALYKKGIDEVTIQFTKGDDIQLVQDALRNSTIGYEIVDQNTKGCTIKNISSNIMGFESMLRRSFLLLISLAEECSNALADKDAPRMKNLLTLEHSNNRFTTVCRRYINKVGTPHQKTGPLYFIIESIEKISDEYKYLIQATDTVKITAQDITPAITDQYRKLARIIRDTHDTFYKFDTGKVSTIGDMRKSMVTDWHNLLKKLSTPGQFTLAHHSIVILQKTFDILGPLMILNATNGKPAIERRTEPSQ